MTVKKLDPKIFIKNDWLTLKKVPELHIKLPKTNSFVENKRLAKRNVNSQTGVSSDGSN